MRVHEWKPAGGTFVGLPFAARSPILKHTRPTCITYAYGVGQHIQRLTKESGEQAAVGPSFDGHHIREWCS